MEVCYLACARFPDPLNEAHLTRHFSFGSCARALRVSDRRTSRTTFINSMGHVLAVCISLVIFLHDMYRLSDLALEAILKGWHPREYDPPHTNIREWIHSIESLCDTYGIPDLQRPQCAAGFFKDELRVELLNVLADARTRFGPVHWDQFKLFMVALDRERGSITVELPLTEFDRSFPGAMGE